MSYDLDQVLDSLVKAGGSDVHFKVRTPVYVRILEQLERSDHPVPAIDDLEVIARRILNDHELETLGRGLQVNGVYRVSSSGHRFRASVYFQRGTLGIVMRHIPSTPPSLVDLGLPEIANEMLAKKRGLLLVTGPAGSGKTTTVASMLAVWNECQEAHVVTLEDPIEYVIESNRCFVTQRQIRVDTVSFSTGLRHVLRQDPDVIFVGEFKDRETVSIALSAAEAGHLVISTLHTPTAPATIEQLVGMYPPQQQDQVRMRLSLTLQGILSQTLITTVERDARVAVFEVFNPTDGIRNLIRQNQTFRIADTMETTPNCCTLKKSVSELLRSGRISPEDARRHVVMTMT